MSQAFTGWSLRAAGMDESMIQPPRASRLGCFVIFRQRHPTRAGSDAHQSPVEIQGPSSRSGGAVASNAGSRRARLLHRRAAPRVARVWHGTATTAVHPLTSPLKTYSRRRPTRDDSRRVVNDHLEPGSRLSDRSDVDPRRLVPTAWQAEGRVLKGFARADCDASVNLRVPSELGDSEGRESAIGAIGLETFCSGFAKVNFASSSVATNPSPVWNSARASGSADRARISSVVLVSNAN
jgi:hypothetical protein